MNLFGGGVKVESVKAKDKSPKLRKQSDLPVPSTASTLHGNLRPASVSMSGLSGVTAPSPPTPWRKASSPSPVSWLQAGHKQSPLFTNNWICFDSGKFKHETPQHSSKTWNWRCFPNNKRFPKGDGSWPENLKLRVPHQNFMRPLSPLTTSRQAEAPVSRKRSTQSDVRMVNGVLTETRSHSCHVTRHSVCHGHLFRTETLLEDGVETISVFENNKLGITTMMTCTQMYFSSYRDDTQIISFVLQSRKRRMESKWKYKC